MDEPRTARASTDWGLLALVIGLSCVLLLPLLDAGFVIDDYHILHVSTIRIDPDAGLLSRNIAELGRCFVIEASPHVQLYRPSVMISYALNFIFSGTDIRAYQTTNLVLHLLGGVVLFWLLRSLFPRASGVLLAGATAVFLTSPIQLEVAAWSAARSDSLSWLFGGMALLWKVRRPQAIVVPVLMAALALSAKESALAFLGVLGLLDVLAIRRDTEAGRRLSALVRRTWPLLALMIVYFLVRWLLFDRVFGRYNRLSGDQYLDARAWLSNVAQSLMVLAVPVSRIAFPSLLERVPLMVAPLLGIGTLGAQTVFAIRKENGRALILASALFAVPLVLGVLINAATHQLVGTRAFYTPMAALAVFLVAGGEAFRPHGWLRWVPVVALLVTSLTLSRPSQEEHLQVQRSVDHTLDSLWTPMRELADRPLGRIALLNYSEEFFFDGGFTMAAAFSPAVQTPFLAKDYRLAKVACNTKYVENTVRFADTFAEENGDMAVFAMTVEKVDDGERRTCSLVSPGASLAVDGAELACVHPARGQVLDIVLDPENPPKPFEFRFRTRGLQPARFALQILKCDGAFPALVVDAAPLPKKPDGDATIHTIPFPIADVDWVVAEREPFGWIMTALADDGSELARTDVTLYFLNLIHKK